MLEQPLATLVPEMIRICSSLSSWGRRRRSHTIHPPPPPFRNCRYQSHIRSCLTNRVSKCQTWNCFWKVTDELSSRPVMPQHHYLSFVWFSLAAFFARIFDFNKSSSGRCRCEWMQEVWAGWRNVSAHVHNFKFGFYFEQLWCKHQRRWLF